MLGNFSKKNLIGKTVFLVPTGNNARYSKEYKTVIITKVSRVNMEYTDQNGDYPRASRFAGMKLVDSCNSGYDVYKTEQEILDVMECSQLALHLHTSLMYPSSFDSLGLEKLRRIRDIIEGAKYNA